MDDVIINPVNFIVAAVVVEGLLTCSLVVLSISNCLSSKRALQNCRLLLFCSDDSAALLGCTLAWVVVLLQLRRTHRLSGSLQLLLLLLLLAVPMRLVWPDWF